MYPIMQGTPSCREHIQLHSQILATQPEVIIGTQSKVECVRLVSMLVYSCSSQRALELSRNINPSLHWKVTVELLTAILLFTGGTHSSENRVMLKLIEPETSL